MKPLVKTFDSLDEGEIYFRKYATLGGFGTHMVSTMRTIDKENRNIYSKIFICSKGGECKMKRQKDTKVKKKTKKKKNTRMGCKAEIRIQKKC